MATCRGMPTRAAGLRRMLAGFDGVVQRGAQHHAEDLDAPPGVVAAGGQAVEPAGDVLAVEPVEADGAEVADDALGRPLVLQSGLVADVDAARGPLLDELADACRARCRSPLPPSTTPPRSRAARCEAKVPSCRGRRLPVTVSMPSTRTTHLSRCRRTVGWPVGFHAMASLPVIHRVIHRPKTAEDPAVLAGSSERITPARLADSVSALGGSRTPNLLIRSQMLYPLSYERSCCGSSILRRSSGLPQGDLEVVAAGVLDVGNVGLERGVVLDDARCGLGVRPSAAMTGATTALLGAALWRSGCRPRQQLTTTATLAGLPSMATRAQTSGSATNSAVPFTRSVSSSPGIMNSKATLGLVTRFWNESRRLLPAKSAHASRRHRGPGRIRAVRPSASHRTRLRRWRSTTRRTATWRGTRRSVRRGGGSPCHGSAAGWPVHGVQVVNGFESHRPQCAPALGVAQRASGR